MTGKLKVSIDRDGCISCGNCWTTCPEFFEQNPDDDRSQVIEEYRTEGNMGEGEAPENLEDLVRRAADLCPVQVIHVK
ncbi:ferredoxin [Candidatus Methanoperedens nitroreducens]|uniref:Ferredoxin n=1 Tax=Candidatus Methanoperedens nitratireducens TaxID=1392998 RepID=A0A062VAE3_9EURY|nr:ferredoxin [Candidatus Methanoperedens nitroreducens]KCZ73443.1 ferredoxin [Candidatus Methanoperedens nitroreducens]MDJ1422601.1 ferredoxin [Candidatus Methanoperedens sp.]